MTTNLRKQNKTFLAQYNEFCPSDPVKLANDRSAAPGASNEPSYFEVGVQYCLIGHEVHISGEAAQSTKGPKEQSEPWFAVADAFIVPDDDDEHPLQTADGYVKMQVSDVRKDRVVYNVEDPAGEGAAAPPPRGSSRRRGRNAIGRGIWLCCASVRSVVGSPARRRRS